MLCTACCQLMISRYINWLCYDEKSSIRTMFYINTFESASFGVDKSAHCTYCAPEAEIFRILHFNDVYDIEEGENEPVGGCHNFKVVLEQNRTKHSLTLFSGDAFSPSTLGFTEQGQQMVQPLNAMKIDAACYGNHDFDYDEAHTISLKKQTNFPWLLANYINKQTGKLLGEAEPYKVLYTTDIKVGVLGIGEEHWADLLEE